MSLLLRSRFGIGLRLVAPLLFVSACSAQGTGSDPFAGNNPIPSPLASESNGPSSPFGSYLAGQSALERGDQRAASDHFADALRANPDNVELRSQIFSLLLSTGDFDGAITSARELVMFSSEVDEARLLLALEHVKQDEFDNALLEVEELSDRGIISVAKPLIRGWAQFGAGDNEGALTQLTPEDATDGLGLVRSYHHASVLALTGQLDEAIEELSPLFAVGQRAPTRLIRALAAMHAQNGDTDAAKKLLRDQSSIGGESLALSDSLSRLEAGEDLALPVGDSAAGMADALFSLGSALSEQRANNQALVLTRLASYLQPNDGEIWLLLGRISLGADNDVEAIRALENVPNDSVFSWDAKLLRADALRNQGDIEEALAILEDMAEERPDRIDALITAGDVLRREERYVDAEQIYSRALDRLDDVQANHWRLFYARGITLERTKRWPEAEDSFLKSLELVPDQPFVLNYLGYSWVDQGLNLDEATDMLNRAVELRPNDGFIVDSLGWAFYRLDRFEEAVEQLERAVELEPGDPVINDHLGDAYWQTGRKREARFQWDRALLFDPEEDVADAIREKLARGLADASSVE